MSSAKSPILAQAQRILSNARSYSKCSPVKKVSEVTTPGNRAVNCSRLARAQLSASLSTFVIQPQYYDFVESGGITSIHVVHNLKDFCMTRLISTIIFFMTS